MSSLSGLKLQVVPKKIDVQVHTNRGDFSCQFLSKRLWQNKTNTLLLPITENCKCQLFNFNWSSQPSNKPPCYRCKQLTFFLTSYFSYSCSLHSITELREQAIGMLRCKFLCNLLNYSVFSDPVRSSNHSDISVYSVQLNRFEATSLAACIRDEH